MTKRKKQRKIQRSPKRPSPQLRRELATAAALVKEGELASAQLHLLRLVRRHPASKPVLLDLLEVCQLMQDWSTYAYHGEQLLPLERGEDQAETLNNLAFAHSKLQHPALLWYYSRELLAKHPDYIHARRIRTSVESIEEFLLQQAGEIIGKAVLTNEEKLELMVEHDRVQFYTESGHPKDSIPAAERILEKLPGMVPVLNNLSLSQSMVGDLDKAIETSQKVLEQQPDNFHALSNLTRCTFLTAKLDQAQAYADRLEQVRSENPDLEVKQAEAFAYLGDDEKVWAAYEQAKGRKVDPNPLLLHLAAVASYRLGNEKEAWRLWKQAVKRLPSFSMAQESLAEKQLPIGERNVPWYWPLQYWMPQDFVQMLGLDSERSSEEIDENKVKERMKSLLRERPYLSEIFPHMLERGDRLTREFVLNICRVVKTPELLQILYDFSLSPYGSDELRLETAQYISQNYLAMLPQNKQVPMWINGQQTELLMIGFEITDEPEPVEGVPEAVLDKHDRAYELLMNNEPEAAEPLLKEIIAAAPDFPSAYNQLAVAYEMQNQSEKARALVEETHARFPDYFFARIALARIRIKEKQIEEARNLVDPLIRRPKLHISEFRALAQAEMEFALADDKPESARTWLNMWAAN